MLQYPILIHNPSLNETLPREREGGKGDRRTVDLERASEMSRPSRPTATAYGPGGEDGMEPCGGLAALFLSFVDKAARGPPLQWTSAQSLPFLGPFLIGKGGQ